MTNIYCISAPSRRMNIEYTFAKIVFIFRCIKSASRLNNCYYHTCLFGFAPLFRSCSTQSSCLYLTATWRGVKYFSLCRLILEDSSKTILRSFSISLVTPLVKHSRALWRSIACVFLLGKLDSACNVMSWEI